MKMNGKRILAWTLALTFCILFAACGASSSAKGALSEQAYASERQDNTASMEAGDMASGEAAGITLPTDARKIILNAQIDMETLDFDAAGQTLSEAAKAAGGYTANAQVEQGSGARWAHYTYRIPADRYAAFLTSAQGAGNVRSRQENSEDVTAAYVDVEARLKSLTLQQERLYAMMENAGELETLLAIQNQLTEVQYQIESYTAQKRAYDDLIDYATVEVTVQEVKRVTEQQTGFLQRLGAAFTGGWYEFWQNVQDFTIWFVRAMPALLLWAVILLVAIKAYTAVRKKRRAAKAAACAQIPVAPKPEEKQ